MLGHIAVDGLVALRVADRWLRLDARESGVPMAVPACYARFIAPGWSADGLTLEIRSGQLSSTESWRSLFYDDATWQLWLDDAGRYIFREPKGSPPHRQLTVDPAFRAGKLVGEFDANTAAGQAVYPLQNMDLVLYANWLAERGDIIVHASGVDDAGSGYCFVGASGAGKSTLAAHLSSRSAVTVLGEDQVILRRHEDTFLVYGTPWHTNPVLCSPGGVPLKKIFFLDRTALPGIHPCGRLEGIQRLLQDSFIPYYNRPGVNRILHTLEHLAAQISFCVLSFQLGTDVMQLIRDV